MSHVLFVFVDGVGSAPPSPTNPFTVSPPTNINRLLQTNQAALCPLDATLGLPGLPQSGTGQYSLFTGDNGAARFGRHYGPWVPTALRQPLFADNILTRAQQRGIDVAFANAYPEELLRAARSTGQFNAVGPLRAGPPLVAAGAGVLVRHTDALQRGAAISSEITNEGWREKLQRTQLPVITAQEAGTNLARIAHQHALTLYAHYTTDQAGHEQSIDAAVAALQTFDEFIGGVVEALTDDVVLVVASDHGNLEDATTGHTRNPAFGLVAGPHHARRASELTSLLDVTPAILRWL